MSKFYLSHVEAGKTSRTKKRHYYVHTSILERLAATIQMERAPPLAMDIRPCRTSRARRRLREQSSSSERKGRMLASFASYWVYPLEIAGSIRLSRRIRGRGVRLPLCIIDDCVLPFGDELTARPLLDISEEIVLYTISRAETGPKKSPTLLKRGLVV